jgi:hypothetical protein
MNACSRRVCLTFHGVEARRGWDLVYDDGCRATVPVGNLLSVHSGFTLFSPRKQHEIFASVDWEVDILVSRVNQLGPVGD